MRSAYLLVTHGSRDIRPQVAIDQLRDRLEQRLSVPVGAAVLECAPTALHEQIEEFSRQHESVSQIQIVPLFLLPGVHVMEDIPTQIAIAQSRIDTKLQILPHLGTHSGMAEVLASRLAEFPADARILMSHGSRRSGGNAPIEEIANAIDAVSAYWSVEPKLETRLLELNQQGCHRIVILPYFLFSGGITDAIERSVQAFSEEHPDLTLQWLAPFDFCEDLLRLITDFITVQSSAELNCATEKSVPILR
ncbi:sirohydrochlorin chelatase [Leptolyngbya sp. FACHB-17]|uniref:sirohydrochlorin chelatase n=1 Tax=unclassified Leptolyngbya TaxID=2650499 RepID=UPI00168161F3|nr:sirohydrochlorin chelatase [Leptolyngbya sp. FACHB-17]MBD2081097.1 sirohydrochlorin chelatase [Leptolyngbya sp. FACHB-17]